MCSSHPGIVACIRVPSDSPPPGALALATSKDEIVLAWASASRDAPLRAVYVARFNADLKLLGQRTLKTRGAPIDTAISALPKGGFMLAVGTTEGVEVGPLNAVLEPTTELRRVAGKTGGGAATYLVARPDGGPLLVWTSWADGQPTFASLLDASGSELWRSQILNGATEPEIGGAVFTGDGFLIASRSSGVVLVRVELDGRVGAPRNPVGSDTEYPLLAWDGALAQMTWFAFGSQSKVRWANVDKSGAIRGEIATLGTMPAYSSPSPPAVLKGNPFVIMGGRTGIVGAASRLDVFQLNRGGGLLAPAWNLMSEGSRATYYRVAPMGDALVVAWLDGASQPRDPAKRIGLARIKP
jgi:hypothetical protein